MAIYLNKNTEIQVKYVKQEIDCGRMIIDPEERFQRRKDRIIRGLDIEKLKNSYSRDIGSTKNSYTINQLTDILISIGIPTVGQKISFVETLLNLKEEYENYDI